MKDVTINIHICLNALLGAPNGIEWRQDRLCVPYWRVYWNSAPGACIITAEGRHELVPDEVVILPPRTEYSTRAERETNHFYLHFSAGEPFDAVRPGGCFPGIVGLWHLPASFPGNWRKPHRMRVLC